MQQTLDRRVVSGPQLFIRNLILVAAAVAVAGQRNGVPSIRAVFSRVVNAGSEGHKPGGYSSDISCTHYISPSGSDENRGTLAEPWKTLQKAFDTATAGQTVCLRGGIYPQYVDASWVQPGGKALRRS